MVVLIDREQGGPERLAESGLKLHSAFTLTAILKVLVAHQLVSSQVEASVKSFLKDNQTFTGSASKAPTPAPKPHRSFAAAYADLKLQNAVLHVYANGILSMQTHDKSLPAHA